MDGKIAYVGGHNVGDEYLGQHPKFGAWRDTHVKIEGPAVQFIQTGCSLRTLACPDSVISPEQLNQF